MKILDYAIVGHPCPIIYKSSRPLDSGQGSLFWMFFLGGVACTIELDVGNGSMSVSVGGLRDWVRC